MAGDGPYLWFTRTAPHGFHEVPKGGFCVSSFLFLRQGSRILLGKYRDHPRWEALAGLDAGRLALWKGGWTIPGTHVRYGEHPRDAAARVAEEHLGLRGVRLGAARVESDLAVHPRFPEAGPHHDLWFFVEAEAPAGLRVEAPPWYEALDWHDPRQAPPGGWTRSHEDVAARWLEPPRGGDRGPFDASP